MIPFPDSASSLDCQFLGGRDCLDSLFPWCWVSWLAHGQPLVNLTTFNACLNYIVSKLYRVEHIEYSLFRNVIQSEQSVKV